MARLHLVISTHTTLHLRRTLMGAACQSRRPDTITVSCDNDSADISAAVERASYETALAITLVQRPFQGESRSGQVRNNAVWSILQSGADSADRLVFLDGDCCPRWDGLEVHEQLGGPSAVVVGFRIDLTPEQTEVFDEALLVRRQSPVRPTPRQLRILAARDRRYRRHAFLRRFGLVKPHKPKLLSANFSVPVGAYVAVNGFDERYTGYGQEDDDLGRRLYLVGVPPVIGVARAIVYHSYHPTRAPGAWEESPNAARFSSPFEIKAPRGLDAPLDQPEPHIQFFAPGGVTPSDAAPAPA